MEAAVKLSTQKDIFSGNNTQTPRVDETKNIELARDDCDSDEFRVCVPLMDSGLVSRPTWREDALIWHRPRVVYHRVYFSIQREVLELWSRPT